MKLITKGLGSKQPKKEKRIKTLLFKFEGKELEGDVERWGWQGEQRWFLVCISGVNWLVSHGAPNDGYPLCEEWDIGNFIEMKKQIKWRRYSSIELHEILWRK
jgi:hypothetical protein